MNLVNAPSEESRQAPVDEPWAQKIKQLFPLKINRFAVHDGEIYYRDFSRKPEVNLPVDRVQMVAVNLTNSKKALQEPYRRYSNRGPPIARGRCPFANFT
jgi:hypothetical protein